MPFNVVDVPQRSPEWFAARCGRLTASQASDMLATVKSGEAAARRDLRTKLVVERLTGQPQEDGFVSKDMERGTLLEADARAAYESTGGFVTEVGFLSHTELMAGCSPDGVMDSMRGILELKVPRSATHLRYLRDGVLPREYVGQVTHQLWISDAEYCDFCSWDPRFPPHLQLFKVRVPRDEKQIATYELAVRLFLSEVERELAELTERAEAVA